MTKINLNIEYPDLMRKMAYYSLQESSRKIIALNAEEYFSDVNHILVKLCGKVNRESKWKCLQNGKSVLIIFCMHMETTYLTVQSTSYNGTKNGHYL